MSSSTLDRVIGDLSDRHIARRAAFRELVEKITSGGKLPDAATIERILDEADETPASLRAAVDRANRRAELRAKLATLKPIQAKIEKVNQKYRTANDALRAAEEAHLAAVRPLEAEIEQLKAELPDVDAINRELIANGEPELVKQLQDAEQEAGRLRGLIAAGGGRYVVEAYERELQAAEQSAKEARAALLAD